MSICSETEDKDRIRRSRSLNICMKGSAHLDESERHDRAVTTYNEFSVPTHRPARLHTLPAHLSPPSLSDSLRVNTWAGYSSVIGWVMIMLLIELCLWPWTPWPLCRQ